MQWLNVPKWNLEAGQLVKGAEVGRRESRPGAGPWCFWAKIFSKSERDAGYTMDIYIVEDAAGGSGGSCEPLFLHRVFVKQFLPESGDGERLEFVRGERITIFTDVMHRVTRSRR